MTPFPESDICDVCGNRHATEKNLTTEALLDLITQRFRVYSADPAKFTTDEQERALHNLHRLGEHVEAFEDRIRAVLMEDKG